MHRLMNCHRLVVVERCGAVAVPIERLLFAVRARQVDRLFSCSVESRGSLGHVSLSDYNSLTFWRPNSDNSRGRTLVASVHVDPIAHVFCRCSGQKRVL